MKESGEERELCAGVTPAAVMAILATDAGVLCVDILCSIVRDFLILIICVSVKNSVCGSCTPVQSQIG